MVVLDAWNGDDVPFRGKDDGERDGLEITHSVEDEIQSFSPGTPFSDVVAKWASSVGIEYTEAQKKQAEARIRRAPAAGEAYGGLVPRKSGEFHHHFTSKLPMTQCVHCGGTVYEPCRGPQADEWEERMQERRSLKERLFWLAYGVSTQGHEEAARAMAEFNAETLRLFPDRFREPTAEEQEARARFVELVSAPLTPTFQQTASEALRVIRERPGHEPYEVPEDEMQTKSIALDGYEAVNAEQEEATAHQILEIDARNEQIRAAKEAAWDEGWHQGRTDEARGETTKNPYRKADRD